MRNRSRLAISFFLSLCLLTFLYTASRAGDTGKEPEDSIAMVSLLVFIFSSALLIALWLRRTIKRRFSNRFSSYLSSVPLPNPHKSAPARISDYSPPVREDDLWPQGLLLYLIGGGPYGKSPVEGLPILMLTDDTLMLAGDTASMEALADNKAVDLEFWNPNPEGAYRVPTTEILRVLISRWGLTPELTVWVRDQNGTERKFFYSLITEMPKPIHLLIAKAKKQMALGKTTNEYTILIKEIERQFKRAAPNAVVTLKGGNVSDEEFARLIR